MKSRLFLFTVIIFISGMISAQDKPESSDKILDEAYVVAAKENKSVMIVFHASWCGWCRKFEASLADPTCKDFFDDHFVIRTLDVLERGEKTTLENPGATDLYYDLAGRNSGIPFFVIFDSKRNLISDSRIQIGGPAPGKMWTNMGCPASEEEVAAFIEMLEKAAKINAAEKTAIIARFKKNKS